MTLKVESAVSFAGAVAPSAWAAGTNRIYYNKRRQEDGLFDGWSCLPNGGNEKNHTNIAAYPTTTHAGISDVTKDGRYALVTVERSGWWLTGKYAPDGSPEHAPGRGGYNDIWIQDLTTNKAWKVRAVTAWGAIWPRFSDDGTKITWSECLAPETFLPALFSLGKWRLHTATVKWANGNPFLADIKTATVQTGFMEPYGFSADNSRVLFAGDQIVSQSFGMLSICEMPSTLVGTATRLSPPDPTAYWENYNEFAWRIPQSDRIIFSRNVYTNPSLEYWTMKSDGSDAQRLTYFSDPGSLDRIVSDKVICGGLAFDPTNPHRFVCGIALDYTDGFTSRMVTLVDVE